MTSEPQTARYECTFTFLDKEDDNEEIAVFNTRNEAKEWMDERIDNVPDGVAIEACIMLYVGKDEHLILYEAFE